MLSKLPYEEGLNKLYLELIAGYSLLLCPKTLDNKPKKRSAFDCKYQISPWNYSLNFLTTINQAESVLNLRAGGKFLSELISYLSGKNIIALSDISHESGSEVVA